MKKWTLLLAIEFAIIAAFAVFAVPGASADAPQPYQLVLVKCTGLTVPQIQVVEQKFDSAYGFRHGLTTLDQWVASYPARVNEFAMLHGCPSVIDEDSGQLTFWYRLYIPIYAADLGAQPY